MMSTLFLSLLLVLQYFGSGTATACDPKCNAWGQGTCQTSGRCLCWWGWTGPNATYISSGVYKNRILADYCTVACHYTHDYLNPRCAKIPTPKVCSVPKKKIVPAIPCDSQCGKGKFHSAGTCLSNGRCLCWWGWTGSHACYVDGGAYNNRILADRCNTACHYTHDYRNVNCTRVPGPTTVPPSIQQLNGSTVQPTSMPKSTSIPSKPPTARQQTTVKSTAQQQTTVKPTAQQKTTVKSTACDPKCKGGQGTCQTSGRCLCWWGWTGPNATYIDSGFYKNRILADYCTVACHYTHDYLNPLCAKIPTPKVCSVPKKKIVPAIPCDSQCGKGKFHSAGTCLSNGRCLCWWGWTGSHACYVDGGAYNNRILADRCNTACHYTHDYRNVNCTRVPGATQQQTTVQSTPQQQTTVQSTPQQQTTAPRKPSTTEVPTTSIPATTTRVSKMSTAQPSTTQKTTTTQGTTTTVTTVRPTTTNAPMTTAAQPDPTEPPEPTEPTEPGLSVRGLQQDAQSGLQTDAESSENKGAEGDDEPAKHSSIAAVVLVATLLVCLFIIGGAVWWKYGNGNQWSSLFKGYEPVENNEINMETQEFAHSSVLP